VLRAVALHTKDAHAFYSQLGFLPADEAAIAEAEAIAEAVTRSR
jgi:hypothetical protein